MSENYRQNTPSKLHQPNCRHEELEKHINVPNRWLGAKKKEICKCLVHVANISGHFLKQFYCICAVLRVSMCPLLQN